jgi:hypothetical protein
MEKRIKYVAFCSVDWMNGALFTEQSVCVFKLGDVAAYRPKRSGALASMVPNAVQIIIPLKYGNELFVTCARINLLTWYEKLSRRMSTFFKH